MKLKYIESKIKQYSIPLAGAFVVGVNLACSYLQELKHDVLVGSGITLGLFTVGTITFLLVRNYNSDQARTERMDRKIMKHRAKPKIISIKKEEFSEPIIKKNIIPVGGRVLYSLDGKPVQVRTDEGELVDFNEHMSQFKDEK